jgi:hypothetical protein
VEGRNTSWSLRRNGSKDSPDWLLMGIVPYVDLNNIVYEHDITFHLLTFLVFLGSVL